MNLESLIGKTIVSMCVAENESVMRLNWWAGERTGSTYLACTGGCCSETWFSDVTGFRAILGEVGSPNPITSAEEIPMPSPQDKRTRQEYDRAYGIVLRTDRGACTMVFRNSSN